MGQNIKSPYSESFEISADGSRLAVTSNATSIDAPGEVNVFDYNSETNEWVLVGTSIKSSSSSIGDGFGFSINMSSDGNFLVIGSNSPKCQSYPYLNAFNTRQCTSGSMEVFNYHSGSRRFQKGIPNSSFSDANGNVLSLAQLVSFRSIFGLHFIMSGDSSVLSISGYDVQDENTFIQIYNLDDFFYTNCIVDVPDWIGNGICNDSPPYNTERCGFDGGDCDRKPVEGNSACLVDWPDLIGDGSCHDFPPYNSEACEYDGGDCDPKKVEGYADCFVVDTEEIGDGSCWDYAPYNTEACGFDGGDCVPKSVEGYPNCILLQESHEWIGNNVCFDWPPYNTEGCGLDGGDCNRNPVEGYPECFVHYQSFIGNGFCHDWPPYNGEKCGFDGGDCDRRSVEGYPNCLVHEPDRIGDGNCDDLWPYNTEDCGFDGGDCLS